jgi:hypothetical protein
MTIPRLELIQSLIDKKGYKKYLEIGVSIGTVFFRIRCKKKIAVDPEFGFSGLKKITRSLRLNNWTNLSADYFEKTSDEFFLADGANNLEGLGISLIDGMHEYSYALNDIVNTLKYLKKDGVIVVHDCNPREESNACSFEDWKKRGFTGEWNGDVWKSIVHLRATRKDINVFVADIDQGLGIITWSENTHLPLSGINTEDIKNFNFSDFERNRKEWLNLKPASYLNEYFDLKLSATI